MDRVTVVFFYGREDHFGRRKKSRWRWHKDWCYEVRRTHILEQGISFQCVQVDLPLRETAKRAWTHEKLASYLSGLDIPPEGRGVYYMPDEDAAGLLGRGAEPFSIEWILLLLAYYHLDFDGLLVLQDREMEAEELIRRFARGTRYLGVVTNQPDMWLDTAEELSEEYGFLLDVVTEFKQHHYRGEKLLIIAGSRIYGAVPSQIPPGSMWLDTDPGSEKGRIICARAGKVTYMDGKCFFRETLLDTAHKIKYNNTR